MASNSRLQGECIRVPSNQSRGLDASCLDVNEPAEDLITLDIGHELRTSLTVIQGAIELLRDGKLGSLSSKGCRMVELAANNVERLMRLTVVLEQSSLPSTLCLPKGELEHLQLQADLQAPLDESQLRLYYQPIMSLETNKIMGFEALLHWQHTSLGLIPLSRFIAAAETTGLMFPITVWALHEACRQLQGWQQRYPGCCNLLTINVNISSKQLFHPDLIEHIRQVLQETGLAAQSLRLEIAEKAIGEDAEAAKVTLEQLHALGVGICIDNFGTGYFSIWHLYWLPLDALKIDCSLVNYLDLEKGAHLVRSLATLTQNLGMKLIAEGIKTAEQIDYLQTLGCSVGQGDLFSQPLDKEAAMNLIHRLALEV